MLQAKADIWRGPFERINEVEEEVMRSSRFMTNRINGEEVGRLWNEVMIPEVDENNHNRSIELIPDLNLVKSVVIEHEDISDRQSDQCTNYKLDTADLQRNKLHSINLEYMNSAEDESNNKGHENITPLNRLCLRTSKPVERNSMTRKSRKLKDENRLRDNRSTYDEKWFSLQVQNSDFNSSEKHGGGSLFAQSFTKSGNDKNKGVFQSIFPNLLTGKYGRRVSERNSKKSVNQSKTVVIKHGNQIKI